MTATMGRWMRRSATLGAALLLVTMLTACIEANTQSTISTDQTGTTMIRIGFSKAAIQAIAAIGNDLGTPVPGAGASGTSTQTDPFATLTPQVTAMGGTVTPYDSGDFSGVNITFTFKSLDEMQKQINSVLGDTSGTSGSSPAAGTPPGAPSALVQVTAKDTGSTIRIDGTVDPLSDLSDPNAAGGAPPGLDVKALLGTGKVQIAFTMPGAIAGADPLATQNGNTVSWSFNIGDKKAAIFVESAKQ